MTLITGPTFHVRKELKEMGAKWNPLRQAWLVPDDRALEAKTLLEVGQARQNVHRKTHATHRKTRRAA